MFRYRSSPAWLAAVSVILAGSAGCDHASVSSEPVPSYAEVTTEHPGDPFAPIPARPAAAPAKVALGERLFQERRLSRDNSTSCASCHDLQRGGTDGRAHARGIRGQEGAMNAPTVFNAAFNVRQFWDGRASTLAEQAGGPLTNPGEMGNDWPTVIDRIGEDATYQAAFRASYEDGITAANVRDAIATYETTLTTPDSRFDRHLRGDRGALTREERRGLELFKGYGCVSCHQGVNLGGNMFQKVGVMADFFKDRGRDTPADQGRFNVTGDPEDRHRFKVPTLRNVALTAPYFHDGSVATLDEAVRLMGRYQVGRTLSPEEVASISSFLGSLTGEYRGKAL